MSDLTDYPRQDKFETTLSQDLDSSATTIFLVTAPSFSLVVGQSCEMIIDYNSNTKYERCTLSGPYTAGVNPLTTITRGNPKYSGGASTAVAHSGGAKVIFAPTYADFENAATAINSKINKSGGTFTGEVNFNSTTIGGVRLNNLTTVQRDALASPANGMMIYNTTTGEANQYLAGAWSAVASGSTQPNASTTVAGKVEVATQAENNAGTSTGGTGALLSTTPDVAAVTAQNNKWVNCVVGGTADVITLTPTPAITAYVDGQEFVFLATGTNTTNVTANVSTLGAKAVTKNGTQALVAGDMVSGCAYRVRYDGTRLQIIGSGSPFGFTAKGDIVVATGANTSSKLAVGANDTVLTADSAEATGQKWVTKKPTNGTTTHAGDTTGAQTIAHGLGIAPISVDIFAIKHISGGSITTMSWGTYNGTTTKGIFGTTGSDTAASTSSNVIEVNDGSSKQLSATITVDATNINLTWSKTGLPSADNIQILWIARP